MKKTLTSTVDRSLIALGSYDWTGLKKTFSLKRSVTYNSYVKIFVNKGETIAFFLTDPSRIQKLEYFFSHGSIVIYISSIRTCSCKQATAPFMTKILLGLFLLGESPLSPHL